MCSISWREGRRSTPWLRAPGARVVVADVGVATAFEGDLPIYHRKIAYGTRNMAKGPAMSRDEAARSIEVGIDVFEAEFMAGPLRHRRHGRHGGSATRRHPRRWRPFSRARGIRSLTGRGTGIDDAGLERKIGVIGRALDVNKPDPTDPLGVLAAVGGFEIGALAGVILASAARRIPVIIDGYISGASALLARALSPHSVDIY